MYYQTVADKTTKNFRGLFYFVAPCRNKWIVIFSLEYFV